MGPAAEARTLASRLAPGLLDLAVTTVAGGVATVADTLRATHTDAFVVLHDGVVACEWYAAPAVATQPHPLHSVTKSFVGVLAGILAGDGRLDPAAPAARYVPRLGRSGYAAASVRDLLDMRTGGDYVEHHDDADGELALMGEVAGWREPTRPGLPGSVRELALRVERVARTSGPFSYRSLDTEVLGWVVEAAAGRPLAELLTERLLDPLGIEGEGELLVDPAGDPVASGGLSLRPRDVARFGQMLLDGGSVGTVQVVPTLFLRDTRMGQEDSVQAFRARVGERIGLDAPYPANGMYRSQFWVPGRGRRQLLCLGVCGQAVLVDADNQVVAVKLSSWPWPQDARLFTDGLSCLSAAAAHLGGRPHDHRSLLR